MKTTNINDLVYFSDDGKYIITIDAIKEDELDEVLSLLIKHFPQYGKYEILSHDTSRWVDYNDYIHEYVYTIKGVRIN